MLVLISIVIQKLCAFVFLQLKMMNLYIVIQTLSNFLKFNACKQYLKLGNKVLFRTLIIKKCPLFDIKGHVKLIFNFTKQICITEKLNSDKFISFEFCNSGLANSLLNKNKQLFHKFDGINKENKTNDEKQLNFNLQDNLKLLIHENSKNLNDNYSNILNSNSLHKNDFFNLRTISQNLQQVATIKAKQQNIDKIKKPIDDDVNDYYTGPSSTFKVLTDAYVWPKYNQLITQNKKLENTMDEKYSFINTNRSFLNQHKVGLVRSITDKDLLKKILKNYQANEDNIMQTSNFNLPFLTIFPSRHKILNGQELTHSPTANVKNINNRYILKNKIKNVKSYGISTYENFKTKSEENNYSEGYVTSVIIKLTNTANTFKPKINNGLGFVRPAIINADNKHTTSRNQVPDNAMWPKNNTKVKSTHNERIKEKIVKRTKKLMCPYNEVPFKLQISNKEEILECNFTNSCPPGFLCYTNSKNLLNDICCGKTNGTKFNLIYFFIS